MNRKVTRELVAQMQQMYDDGYTIRTIANAAGVSKSTVSKHVQSHKYRKKLDVSGEAWDRLPTKPEEVVLHDVKSDNAKYKITLNDGLSTREWFTNTYPNWRHMYEHCLYYGIKDVADFKDINSCMKPNTKRVRGVVISAHGKKCAAFTIDLLKDEPVEFSDLLL